MYGKFNTVTIVSVFLISIVAFIFAFFIKVPISFLSYDPKDILIVYGGLIFGVIPSIIICLLSAFLEMITSNSDIFGLIMNFLSSMSFSLPIVIIYTNKLKNSDNKFHIISKKINKKEDVLIIGLIISAFSQALFMCLFNLIR